MGLDFDALEYCKNVKIKQSVPPYACPVLKCGRSYKTIIGLQYHLVNYDHDNPQPLTPIITPNRKKARSRSTIQSTKGIGIGIGSGGGGGIGSNNNANIRCGSAGDDDFNGGIGGAGVHHITNPESLVSYNDEEQTVTFNIEGKSVRLGIHQPLPFIEDDEYIDLVERGCIINADAPPVEKNAPWTRVKVPEARFQEICEYCVQDAAPRSGAYYRFIEKSGEELDGEIEYDVDEEDSAWLQWINEEREKSGQNAVNIDTMELLMDRLEKESYFQAAANGTSTGTEVDDDAVCCICMDGECQNTNVILFCDMCNLAVHQDCYGVPYIPEGQWLCRRCLQSPSTPVNCVLCPNTGGAFKQTDRGQWAHVVCALWIPEVRFANTVFLEPIDSIETIPAARWRLTCYVCKEKGLGACIQCHRNSCYAAFHVTCAQQAGLYMTMDMNEGTTHNESSVHVQKYAFCHAHTPEHAKSKLNLKDFEDARHKMKEARKALAKKRSSAPIVLIPTIPPERIQEISGMVHMQKKKDFLDRLIAYWTLKRKYRNGVPLLRRLQSQGNNHGVIQRNGIEGSPDTSELYRQLKYWQCLRQDLERARLLCELVRKREKLKAAYVKICEQVVMLQLNPLESVLIKLLDALEARDTSEIFREPVDTTEVSDYLDIVTSPMDLGTMRTKLHSGQYTNLDQLRADFDLMIQNCLAYNNKDTVFYRAGIRMRDQGAPLFQQVREDLAREGLLDTNQSEPIDHVEVEVEEELQRLLASPPCEAIVQKLLILADKSQVLKNPTYRTKKIKQIRLEISRMRKTIQKAKITARHNASSHMDDNDDIEENHNIEDMDVDTPIKHLQSYTHPEQMTPKRKRTRVPPQNHLLSDDDEIYEDDDDDDDNDDEEDEDEVMRDASKDTTSHHTVQTPPSSPVKSLNSSASPVGVNRRTAVLFTRKAQAALKRPNECHSSTPVKEEHCISNSSNLTATTLSLLSVVNNNNNNNNNTEVAAAAATNANAVPTGTVGNNSLVASASSMSAGISKFSGGLNQLTPLSASLSQVSTVLTTKSPKRNVRHKRLSEMRNSASMSPKKSPNRTPLLITPANSTQTHHHGASLTMSSTHTSHIQQQQQQPAAPNLSNYDHMPEKFRIYRNNTVADVSDSDEDGMSDMSGSPCSSCSGFSVSGTASDYDSSEDDDEEEEADDDEEEEGEDEDQENGNGTDGAASSPTGHECLGNISRHGNGRGVVARGGGVECDSEGNADSDTQTRSIARRTPTPSSKRPRNATRAKQKKKLTNSPPTTTTAAATPPLKNNTRLVGKPLTTTQTNTVTSTTATTTINTNPTIITTTTTTIQTPNNVNSMKTNKSYNSTAVVTNNNGRPKLNNVHAMGANEGTDCSANVMTCSSTANLLKPPLEPLQLVWAKCRGYPWYPALILDPKTPKGFVYNGVPLPAPPSDVLALRKNYPSDMKVFLVLFFDAKRTWQWLPANKLEILGIDKELDQQKLIESRKPTERKAVKKAYQDALHYQSQVSDLEGQGPDPIM